MKKIILFIVGFFCICCKSSQIKPETKVIDAYINQVLLNVPNSITKRYYEEGIRIKEIKGNKWFSEYYSRETMEPENFYPKLSDSLFDILFSKRMIESYKNQLLDKSIDLSKINRLNKEIEIRPYSEEINEKYKYYKLPIINISKPLFSVDGNFAIIYYTNSHETYLYLFKIDKENWKYLSTYNLLFPYVYNSN